MPQRLTKSSGMTDTDTISICTYNSVQIFKQTCLIKIQSTILVLRKTVITWIKINAHLMPSLFISNVLYIILRIHWYRPFLWNRDINSTSFRVAIKLCPSSSVIFPSSMFLSMLPIISVFIRLFNDAIFSGVRKYLFKCAVKYYMCQSILLPTVFSSDW